MKFYVNESGYKSYCRMVEKHKNVNIHFSGSHQNANIIGLSNYYIFDFGGNFRKRSKYNFSGYQNMSFYKDWHVTYYEIDVEFFGKEPKTDLECRMYPDIDYKSEIDRLKRSYTMHLFRNYGERKTEELYYTTLIK